AGFCVIETRVAEPMFRLSLFRIRPFTAGNLASLLSSLGRGGLMFILIIWLQGIYLPIHGYSFERTPLWAGIAMLPLTVGFLIAQGVPPADAPRLAAPPPVSIMFAALLGYNPIGTLLGPALAKLPAGHAAYLTGHTFFPSLISAPFQQGLDIAFDFAIAACLVAAVASLLRGRRYVHDEQQEAIVAAAEVESGDDLEGSEAGVLGVGDPAPVAGHLAQRG